MSLMKTVTIIASFTIILPSMAFGSTGPSAWHYVWDGKQLNIREQSASGPFFKHFRYYQRTGKDWTPFSTFLENSLSHFDVNGRIEFRKVPINRRSRGGYSSWSPHQSSRGDSSIALQIWSEARDHLNASDTDVEAYLENYDPVTERIWNHDLDVTVYKSFRPPLSYSIVYSSDGHDTKSVGVVSKRIENFSWDENGDELLFETAEGNFSVKFEANNQQVHHTIRER